MHCVFRNFVVERILNYNALVSSLWFLHIFHTRLVPCQLLYSIYTNTFIKRIIVIVETIHKQIIMDYHHHTQHQHMTIDFNIH